MTDPNHNKWNYLRESAFNHVTFFICLHTYYEATTYFEILVRFKQWNFFNVPPVCMCFWQVNNGNDNFLYNLSYRLRIEALLIKEEFNHNMDWIRSSVTSIILTAQGNFQIRLRAKSLFNLKEKSNNHVPRRKHIAKHKTKFIYLCGLCQRVTHLFEHIFPSLLPTNNCHYVERKTQFSEVGGGSSCVVLSH